MKLRRVPLAAALISSCLFINPWTGAQSALGSGWHPSSTPFRVLSVAGDSSSIWACGTDEGIAVSSDGGSHWQLKHETPEGNLLLNIAFANSKFGYAAGTGGLILTTDDRGETWTSHSGPDATILQISFADPEHGLIRTPDALEFTSDGGKNWSAVSVANDPDVLNSFRYPFSLATLDAERMAGMLKQGPAQYEPQTFLVTTDAGKTWQKIGIPSVTLYSFLAVRGKYWAVGTEVVGKDKPGGGHGVPVALYSSDGVKWDHSTNDLSSCGPEMCVACTPQGCLSSNGTISDIFGQRTTIRTFSSDPKLTAKWAASESAMCVVGSVTNCTALMAAEKPSTGGDPIPAVVAPGPLGVHPGTGPHCISCELDPILIDPKKQGVFTIGLSIEVARDGTVMAVEAIGAPTPQIKSRIEQQAQQWLFEPYVKDGARVNLKLNTRIQIQVVHPR